MVIKKNFVDNICVAFEDIFLNQFKLILDLKNTNFIVIDDDT